jgi:hypothetical protein
VDSKQNIWNIDYLATKVSFYFLHIIFASPPYIPCIVTVIHIKNTPAGKQSEILRKQVQNKISNRSVYSLRVHRKIKVIEMRSLAFSETSGSHGVEYEDDSFLGYSTVLSG